MASFTVVESVNDDMMKDQVECFGSSSYDIAVCDARDPTSSTSEYVREERSEAIEVIDEDGLRDATNQLKRDFQNIRGVPVVGSLLLKDSHVPLTNSILDGSGENDLSFDADNGSNSIFDANHQKIEKAREILMRLTCQGPLIVEKESLEKNSEVVFQKPNLTALHSELKQRYVDDLQRKFEMKEMLFHRTLDANNNLKNSLLGLREEYTRVAEKLELYPRTRLHLELVEKFNDKLHDTIESKNLLIQEASSQNDEFCKELHDAKLDLRQVQHDKGSLAKELRRRGECEKELRATNCLVRAARRELELLKAAHRQEMKDMVNKHDEKVLSLQVQLRALRLKYGQPIHDEFDDDELARSQDPMHLRARLQFKNESIAELRDQVLASESTRRKLHNVIQELRGNIRVFVRVRPFLDEECQSKNRKREVMTPINVVEAGNALTISGKHENATFQFDKVYGPSSSQEDVFGELSDFVQSALDGYSACIFAYGQTGSGKTHTMQGEGFGDMRGITPRAVEQILRAGNLMKHTRNFYIQANFVEIYNEKLVDLLSEIQEEIQFFNSCDDELMTLNPGINKGSKKLTLRKDVLGQTFVEGLTNVMIDITDIDKGMAMVNSILKCAARARTVAATKMNDRSSRSHSVFTLDIAGKNLQSGAVTAGSLHLVDLAGSERLNNLDKNIDSKQLKETTNINKSLSCLGDVFSALASEASHIPYRNSKLTHLLQNCLGGDGKACMVVNLSPTVESCNESMNSLKFAQRVSQIELGCGSKKVHLSKC